MNKPYSDSYLLRMPKSEIIGILRCTEHNQQAAEEQRDILSFEYEHFTRHLMDDGIMNIKEVNRRMLQAQSDYEKSLQEKSLKK